MNAQPITDIIHIPLTDLLLSARNARKTRTGDVEGLAASIAAHELLQNLIVQPGANDTYEVVAGGRRLAALQLLAQRGELPTTLATRGVPCQVIVDDDVALEASTAENTLREAMHPADQFDAFAAMVKAKKPVADIAAHFGVAESVVTQRLKLANVAPKLLQVYRDGDMTLEQLQALALTDDHAQQRKVWDTKETWQRRPDEIRKRITQKEAGPDNPLVKFVGAAAYEAAGGPVRRDMFSSAVYFGDLKLLDTLAQDKLERIAQGELAAGWSWVETHLELDYAARSKYGYSGLSPTTAKATPEQQARLDAISKRHRAIEEQRDGRDDLPDALLAELDALEDERDGIREGLATWSEASKAKSGVLIYVDRYEGLMIERGRLQPGQRVASAKAAKSSTNDKRAKATLSSDMVQRLEMHRAAATRVEVAKQPALALQLLLAQLLGSLLTNTTAEPLLDLRPSNQHRDARGLIDSKFGDVGKAPARAELESRIARWQKAGMPGKASDLFAWISTLDSAQRGELFALAVALTIGTNAGQRGALLAELFNVDMTQWWTPTEDRYLALVPKALLADAVVDVVGKSAGEEVSLLKKDAAIAASAKHLTNSGWLPKPLRGAGYKLPTKLQAKPVTALSTAAGTKAKKAAAKKAMTAKPKKIASNKGSKR